MKDKIKFATQMCLFISSIYIGAELVTYFTSPHLIVRLAAAVGILGAGACIYYSQKTNACLQKLKCYDEE